MSEVAAMFGAKFGKKRKFTQSQWIAAASKTRTAVETPIRLVVAAYHHRRHRRHRTSVVTNHIHVVV